MRNPTITLKVDGNDLSDYVVSSSRKHSLINPIAELELQMAPDLPITIEPYQDVEFYECGTLVFTGYTQERVKKRMPVDSTLICSDVLIRTDDYWLTDNYTSDGENTVAWITKFLNKSGISNVDTNIYTETKVYPGYGWSRVNAWQAITTTLEMTPYQVFANHDGSVNIHEVYRKQTPDHTLRNFISFERKFSDSTLRNRVVVFGNGFAVEEYKSNSYLLPGEVRTAAAGTGQIHNPALAEDIAEDMVEHFSKPLDVKIIEMQGNPDYKIAQTVDVYEPTSGYSRSDCLITGLTSTYNSDSGYTVELTLDEKFGRFWGWDREHVPPEPLSPLYAGTWGKGVYKTTDGTTWAQTALNNTKVYDIAVPDDKEVWAACEGGIYSTMDSGDSWEKQTMGTPSDQDAGVVESDLYWPGVVVDPDGYVYCLAGDVNFHGIWIYKSTDKGLTWTNKKVL
jgi:hypothetical protein